MPLTRRSLLAASAVAGAVVISRSARADRMRLRITRHRIPWLGKKKLRILHLTDVHMGATTPEKFLHRTVEIAHSLEPDLVALTGDYVNRSTKHADRLRRYVRALPQPVIATLGNHDHWSGAHEVSMALLEGGAEVLSNRASGIDGISFTLDVVGIDDGMTKHADVAAAFRGIQRPEESVVLNHYPATADEIATYGGRLILSGHTHGGQLAIPVLTEAVSRLFNGYFHGWYQIEESELYVSAGIGHSLDGLRGGHTAIPEIAVYDLDPNARVRESRTYRGA
jgi:predicted MPP superfamily phosphohydrolase